MSLFKNRVLIEKRFIDFYHFHFLRSFRREGKICYGQVEGNEFEHGGSKQTCQRLGNTGKVLHHERSQTEKFQSRQKIF